MNHLKITYFVLVMVALSTMGLALEEDTPSEDDAVELSFAHPKKPRSEIRGLKRRAKQGDGEAAFELWGYYALSVEGNVEKMNRYFKRAVELEYPNALYNKALESWVYDEFPNIAEVEALLKKAISKGFIDERGLLDEVLLAKSTGIVPKQSKFRLFLDVENSGRNNVIHSTEISSSE